MRCENACAKKGKRRPSGPGDRRTSAKTDPGRSQISICINIMPPQNFTSQPAPLSSATVVIRSRLAHDSFCQGAGDRAWRRTANNPQDTGASRWVYPIGSGLHSRPRPTARFTHCRRPSCMSENSPMARAWDTFGKMRHRHIGTGGLRPMIWQRAWHPRRENQCMPAMRA